MRDRCILLVLLALVRPNLSAVTPASCNCPCEFIKFTSFWVDYSTNAGFAAILQATTTYNSISVASAQFILGNAADSYHQELLTAELNAAWNGDIFNILPGSTFGHSYWTGSGTFYLQTINQITIVAANTSPESASQELLDILALLGGGGANLLGCNGCTVSCTLPSVSPSTSNSMSVTPSASTSKSFSPSSSNSLSRSISNSFSPSASPSPSATLSTSYTSSQTPTSSYTGSGSTSCTSSATPSSSATTSASSSASSSESASPSGSGSSSSSSSQSPSISATTTESPAPTLTVTATATRTRTHSRSTTHSVSPSHTGTGTRPRSPSSTKVPSGTATATRTQTNSRSHSKSHTQSKTPSPSKTATRSHSPSHSHTHSKTPTPTRTQTRSLSHSHSRSHSKTPSHTSLVSKIPSISASRIPFSRILWDSRAQSLASVMTRYSLDITLQICSPGLTVDNFVADGMVLKDMREFFAAALASAGFHVSIASIFVKGVEDAANGAARYFGPSDDVNTLSWSLAERSLAAQAAAAVIPAPWAAATQQCINVTLLITDTGRKESAELRRYLLPQVGTADGSTICTGFAQRHEARLQLQDSSISLLSVSSTDNMLGSFTERQIADELPASGITANLVMIGNVVAVVTAALVTAVLW